MMESIERDGEFSKVRFRYFLEVFIRALHFLSPEA